MSNSALATVKVPAYEGNYTKGRQKKITKITIHHMAGVLSAKRCGELFQALGRKGSSHYGIGKDGEIGLYVNEADTAWADGNWDSNCESVSIETSNSATGGDWKVSDAALKSLIKLVADIAKRNNLGTLVKGKNLTWHRMYAATTCPGEYLLSKMDYIAEEANKINFPENKKTVHTKIDGINVQRKADCLVLYKDRPSTGTNKWGTEIAFNSQGTATSAPISGEGDMKIPEGGFVLSGHGKGAKWISNNVQKGSALSLSVTIST